MVFQKVCKQGRDDIKVKVNNIQIPIPTSFSHYTVEPPLMDTFQ